MTSIVRAAGSRLTSGSIAVLLAVLLVGSGCQDRSSDAPTDASPTTRYDGTYGWTVDWSTVKPCPDDDPPPTGVGVNELVFDRGSVQMWGWTQGREDLREVQWDGTYTFFRDQLRVEDATSTMTFDFSSTGGKLTLSNLRGGTCGDARAWTSKPWVRKS